MEWILVVAIGALFVLVLFCLMRASQIDRALAEQERQFYEAAKRRHIIGGEDD